MSLDKYAVHRSSDHMSSRVDVVTLIRRAKSDEQKEKKRIALFALAASTVLLLFGFIISL